jgi:predicted nucleotidyltransferase
MKTLLEIKSTLGKHRQYLFRSYPIESMAIFGSYARSEQTDDSDVDIIVEFNDKIGIRFIDLADEIEKLIGHKVENPVKVTTRNRSKLTTQTGAK